MGMIKKTDVKEGRGPLGIIVWVTVTILLVVPAVMFAYGWVKGKWFTKAPATT